MSDALAIITGDIEGARDAFNAALVDRSLSFEREAGFAIQVLAGNDYALGVGLKNRQSVVNAVTNVAAIGLSLNPAKKQAYLVPRDGRICLDISYIGLVELAVSSGSIRWAKAEIVREQDSFRLAGYDRPPEHNYNPFARDRGEPVGAYVVVKTADGDYLTDVMSLDEINAIRDRSSAWKAWVEKKRSCPWVTDWCEMAKKTVVKRASKLWPKTDRLDQAVHHLNTDGEEGLVEVVERVQRVDSLQSLIAQVKTFGTEQELTKFYAECMGKFAAANDGVSAREFKAAATAHRDALRAQRAAAQGAAA
jgi:recombination protein RecT